ncbi:MAG: aldehyde dehydrogenase family protein, partial [Planctomycetota bacterium]
ASEQSIVCFREIREAMLSALRGQGCHICSADELKKLEKIVVQGRRQNPAIVGQYPRDIAKMAGFSVPHHTTVLICEYDGVGFKYPLSIEKLSPVLAFYTVRDLKQATQQADELLRFGGDGHTLAIHTRDEEVVFQLAESLPACRIMINAPTSQGSVGFATALVPALTLGCGTLGNNISSNNISPRDLINRKRVAFVRPEITEPDFDADAYFAKVREAYGFSSDPAAAGPAGPVRPYLHPKAAATAGGAGGGAGGSPPAKTLSRSEVETILARSFS